MADIDRVELLMRLSQNARADNDDWRRQIWREGAERAKRIGELLDMFAREYEALEGEQRKLAQYIPVQRQEVTQQMPIPKVAGGPKS